MNKFFMLVILVSTSLFAERVLVTEQDQLTRPFVEKVKVGEQCYEDTVKIPIDCGRDTNSIGVDTLIGTTLGVVIGNQIGHGNGRDAAKVIGGILGASTANNMRNRGCNTYETITKCQPKYEYKTFNRTIGWNNCAYIDGQRYCKQTKTPIKFLHIRKSITVY